MVRSRTAFSVALDLWFSSQGWTVPKVWPQKAADQSSVFTAAYIIERTQLYNCNLQLFQCRCRNYYESFLVWGSSLQTKIYWRKLTVEVTLDWTTSCISFNISIQLQPRGIILWLQLLYRWFLLYKRTDELQPVNL